MSGGTSTSTGYLVVTGPSARPGVPTAMGCYLGCDNGSYSALELCAVNGAYIDFKTASVRFKAGARFNYCDSSSQFDWYIASSFTSKMTLKSGGLYLGATLVSSSDKRLKFNEKPLINALDVINKLEPVEYDHTFD